MRSAFVRSVRSLWTAAMLGIVAGGPAVAGAAIPGSPTVPQRTEVRHLPVHGEPQIRDVQWHDTAQQLHPGSTIDATVIVSDNVGYVEGRVRTWNVIFRHTAPGRFELNYRVPLLPPMALGAWDIELIARSVDGVEVKRTYHFDYHYF